MANTLSIGDIVPDCRAWLVNPAKSSSDIHPDTIRTVKVLYQQLLTTAQMIRELIGDPVSTPHLLIAKSHSGDDIHVEVHASDSAARRREEMLCTTLTPSDFITMPLNYGQRGILYSTVPKDSSPNVPVKRSTVDTDTDGAKRACTTQGGFSREADTAKFGSIPTIRRINTLANLGQRGTKYDRLWLTHRHLEYTKTDSIVCIICLSALSETDVYRTPCCKRILCNPCLSVFANNWIRRNEGSLMPCMACRTNRNCTKQLTMATEPDIVRFRVRYQQIADSVNGNIPQNEADVPSV